MSLNATTMNSFFSSLNNDRENGMNIRQPQPLTTEILTDTLVMAFLICSCYFVISKLYKIYRIVDRTRRIAREIDILTEDMNQAAENARRLIDIPDRFEHPYTVNSGGVNSTNRIFRIVSPFEYYINFLRYSITGSGSPTPPPPTGHHIVAILIVAGSILIIYVIYRNRKTFFPFSLGNTKKTEGIKKSKIMESYFDNSIREFHVDD